jgi:hypothetical protein
VNTNSDTVDGIAQRRLARGLLDPTTNTVGLPYHAAVKKVKISGSDLLWNLFNFSIIFVDIFQEIIFQSFEIDIIYT